MRAFKSVAIGWASLASACGPRSNPEKPNSGPSVTLELPDATPASLDAGNKNDALTVSSRCLPRRVMLPVRVQQEALSAKSVPPMIQFLRPVCVASPSGTRCWETPDETKRSLTSSKAIAAEGVGLLHLEWKGETGHETLAVLFDRLDPKYSMSGGFRLDNDAAIREDCCSSLKWTADGDAHVYAHGSVVRADPQSPWVFEAKPPLCAPEHSRGDDRLVKGFTLDAATSQRLKAAIPNAILDATAHRATWRSASATIDVDRTQLEIDCPAEDVPGFEQAGGVELTGDDVCEQHVIKMQTNPKSFHTVVTDFYFKKESGKWIEIGRFKQYEGPLDSEERGGGSETRFDHSSELPTLEFAPICAKRAGCMVETYRYDGRKLALVSKKLRPFAKD